jgi:hypothetical protein
MSFKNKIYFIILGLVGQLFFFGYIGTEPLGASDKASEQKIFLSLSIPQTDRLTLVSLLPVILEGEILGRVAVYDDATTERPADYLELYNSTGGLLAVGWLDRFGIERLAVDRGLLEDANKLEGVFVVLLDGDPV